MTTKRSSAAILAKSYRLYGEALALFNQGWADRPGACRQGRLAVEAELRRIAAAEVSPACGS